MKKKKKKIMDSPTKCVGNRGETQSNLCPHFHSVLPSQIFFTLFFLVLTFT